MVELGEEGELLLKRRHRLLRLPFERRDVPPAHVAADDLLPFAAGEKTLLQVDGALGGGAGAGEIARQGARVRQLQPVPARQRVELDGALVARPGTGEVTAAEQQRAAEPAEDRGISRRERQRVLD